MQKSNRLFRGGFDRQCNRQYSKWLCLAVAMILTITSLSLPLWARNSQSGQDGRGLMGDIREGIRDFGRDVSDAVDPDGDGILPDGSIDNGIADDGSQNMPDGDINNGDNNGDNGTIPEATETPTDGTDSPNVSDPVPETSANTSEGTNENAPGTSALVTTDTAENNGDTTDNADGSGFRWGGLIIALVIAAAVVLLIVMLIPKRKD